MGLSYKVYWQPLLFEKLSCSLNLDITGGLIFFSYICKKITYNNDEIFFHIPNTCPLPMFVR